MIQVLERAMNILDLLATENKKCSIAEISTKLDLSSSTVHRILNTLLSKRFVEKDESSKLYYLGSHLIFLGQRAFNYVELRKIAMPLIKKLSEKTGEDVYLAIRSGYHGFIIDKEIGNQHIKYVEMPGNINELHCGAIRKVLLAFQNEEFIDEYTSRPDLVKYTDNTVVDPDVLRKQLKIIKNDGYAITYAEYIDGVFGFGAPIFDSTNEIVASMGILAPEIRINDKNKNELVNNVKKCSIEISKRMGSTLPYINE